MVSNPGNHPETIVISGFHAGHVFQAPVMKYHIRGYMRLVCYGLPEIFQVHKQRNIQYLKIILNLHLENYYKKKKLLIQQIIIILVLIQV